MSEWWVEENRKRYRFKPWFLFLLLASKQLIGAWWDHALGIFKFYCIVLVWGHWRYTKMREYGVLWYKKMPRYYTATKVLRVFIIVCDLHMKNYSRCTIWSLLSTCIFGKTMFYFHVCRQRRIIWVSAGSAQLLASLGERVRRYHVKKNRHWYVRG
jgi:hypothetical protein